jgi:hypothetical protein
MCNSIRQTLFKLDKVRAWILPKPSKIKARGVIVSGKLLSWTQYTRETENTLHYNQVRVIIKLDAELSDSVMRHKVIRKSFHAR